MDITSKLRSLVEIISTRGVGHTSLMRIGTDSYSKKFIQLGVSHSQMRSAEKEANPNAVFITINDVDQGKAKGLDLPVAVDNYVIRELAEDAALTIECMQSSLTTKNQVMEELMNLVEYYQDRTHSIEKLSFELATTPWWKVIRIIRLEKKIHQMILEYNNDSNKVEDSFKRILKIANEHKWQNYSA